MFFVIFCLYYYSQIGAANDRNNNRKEFILKWEEVEGAIKYQVIVKTKSGKVIINKQVQESQIELFIPRGDYQIKIGAINIFGKVGSWSDWENFTVKKAIKEKSLKYVPIGIRIQGGGIYNQLLSPWNNIYDNTYKGTNIRMGYFLKSINWLGFELDGTFFRTKGDNKDLMEGETDLEIFLIGSNVLLKTAFTSQVSLIACFGFGFSNTRQNFIDYDYINNVYEDKEVVTRDYYAKIGCALEFAFYEYFFIGARTEYYQIFYLGEQLKGLQYNLYLGCKF